MKDQRLNVVVAAGLYPPDVGGPATYAALIEKELSEHDISVKVVPFRSVRPLPKMFRHVVYFFKVWRAAKRADCIYALDPVSVGVPAAVVAKLRKVPLLLRLGGDYAWEQGRQRFGVTGTLDEYSTQRSKARLTVQLLHRVQCWVASRATTVIVPSQYLKKIVSSWPVPAEKIQVIYSVLSPLPAGDREAARTTLGVSGNVICTAARLAPWKGVASLIQVVAALRDTQPVTLLVAGDGPERSKLEALTTELGCTEQVRFLGSLDKSALATAVRASDVFVLNTAYEGLSHQLLEVMDLGVPIVTTNVGGNPELITDGTSGLLVAFDDVAALTDAVTRVLADEALRQQLVESARTRVNDFTAERMLAILAKTLRETVGK